jgi:hypothetical protein
MDWIERLFGVSLDGGNGTVEWVLVAAAAAVAIALARPLGRRLRLGTRRLRRALGETEAIAS